MSLLCRVMDNKSAEEDCGARPPESFKKYRGEADAEAAGGVILFSDLFI